MQRRLTAVTILRCFGDTSVPVAPALVRSLLSDLPRTGVRLASSGGSGWRLQEGHIVPTAADPSVVFPRLSFIPEGQHRYLAVTVIHRSTEGVGLRLDDGTALRQAVVTDPVPGLTQVLVWDLSGAGDPRQLTLRPGSAEIVAVGVVDVP